MGSFAQVVEADSTNLEKGITRCKTWIVVVSLCAFILDELPQFPVAQRGKAVSNFQNQILGCEAPANLVKYLEAEKKKCQ